MLPVLLNCYLVFSLNIPAQYMYFPAADLTKEGVFTDCTALVMLASREKSLHYEIKTRAGFMNLSG